MSRTIAQREALRLARYAHERVGKLTPEEWALWLAGEMLRDQLLEVAAERRRICKALRNVPVSDYNSGEGRARLVYLDDALECVTPRQVRAMTGGGERR